MKRPLAAIGFSYFITLAFLIFVPETLVLYTLILFTALFLFSVIIKETRNNKVFPVVFLTCAAASSVYFLNLNTNIKPVQDLDETNASITGTICDIPYKKNNKYQYIIEVKKLNNENIKPFRIKLSSPEAIEGDLYDDFTGNIYLYVPKNTPAFDSQIYYRSKNIYIHAFLYNYEENFTQKPKTVPPYYHILKLRQKIISTSKRIFPTHTASVINAIFLGEKHELEEDVKNNFDITGASHIFTISGIHISVLSQFCLWIFKKLRFNKRFSCVLSALSVFFVMGLTCFTPLIVKAGIMCIIYLLGLSVFRKSDPINSLGISVFLICLFSPDSALDIGLWMGFFSTLGIVTAYKPIQNFMRKKLTEKLYDNKLLNYIISSIAVSLSVWLFTLPMSAWFFKKISLVSPVSNLILIPASAVTFNTSLIINFLSIISAPAFLTHPVALICGSFTNFIILTSKILAEIPFMMISLDYTAASLWAAFTVLLASVCLYSKNLKKSSRIAALLSLNLAFVSAFSYQLSAAGTTGAAVINCSDGVGFILSKNGRRSAVLCLNGDSDTKNIKYFLSRSYIKNIDCLSMPILDATHKTAAHNIIKAYNPSTTVLSGKNSADPGNEENHTRLIYFDGHVESSFWNDTEISALETNGHTYIRVKVSNAEFLICANGGSAEDIPDKWKECDFLIANGLPFNYSKIKSKHNILSGSRTDSEINAQKLALSGKDAFSTAHQGEIHIRIRSDGSYDIRRSQ